MLKFVVPLFALGLVAACQPNGMRDAGPLNDWELSCGADPESMRQTMEGWVFRTSDNYCTGGTFNQRAEIFTEEFPVNSTGSVRFTSNISFTSAENREFSIFSIHDGRNGCAPPLQLFVRPDGRMYIASAIKTGPGESCIDQRLSTTSQGRIRRDGTEQQLAIVVRFDGAGGFGVVVSLNGETQISGRYRPPTRSDAIVSQRFYFQTRRVLKKRLGLRHAVAGHDSGRPAARCLVMLRKGNEHEAHPIWHTMFVV
ncbi:hypothetical protein [Pseudooctadecabacter sp.]|uniref:hypothetical protein n=1 Tax=Pseudooctadecabacter sp. TaxID=1966338 RepID=UPI0035C85FDD